MEIKTKAVLGDSEARIDVVLNDSSGEYTGRFHFGFLSRDYHVYNCKSGDIPASVFPKDIPGSDTVIKIVKTQDGTSPKVSMFYNDVEVLSLVFSEETCSDYSPEYYGDVAMIQFKSEDKSSNFYKPM